MSSRPGLEALFEPRSVAVVGASRSPGVIGHEIFKNLLDAGFQGPVYPVNPNAEVVRSVRAYPSVAAIPDPVDLAVITVPARFVLEVVDECGAKGVKGLVVITAGFGEIGGEGLVRQEKLEALVDRYGMRMVGPNCLGLLNTAAEHRLNATFAPNYPPPGKVAFASQSGALGVAILDHARELGIGISTFVSVGNRADLQLHELLAYWRDDPRTELVLLYMESFGDADRFKVLASEVSRTTPIIAVKGGRSAAGAKAASSHTGSLAGRDVGVDALFGQAGVIRVESVEELFDTAMLLENQPFPKGDRLGILTNAGGPGILAADAAEGAGLRIPAASGALRAKLAAALPAEASTSNPVDMIAGAGPDQFEHCVEAMLASGEFDALLVLFVPPVASATQEVARRIVARARGATIPVVTCFLGTNGVPEALRTLGGGSIPSYRYPEAAVRSLARALAHQRWRDREEVPAPDFTDLAIHDGKAALAHHQDDGWLTDPGCRDLLAAYGVPHVETHFAATEEEAVAVQRRVGLPMAMKVVAEGVLHKSDVQGVQLDLADERRVRAGFQAMQAGLESIGRLSALRGVLLQPMIRGGVEIALGMARDPVFGPLVMVGIGGVNLELLGDVRFGLHPLSRIDVDEMLRGLQGFALLDGYRGAPKADVAALTELVLRMDRMIAEHPGILEMDLNPVMVLPAGQGCTVVDVRVKTRT